MGTHCLIFSFPIMQNIVKLLTPFTLLSYHQAYPVKYFVFPPQFHIWLISLVLLFQAIYIVYRKLLTMIANLCWVLIQVFAIWQFSNNLPLVLAGYQPGYQPMTAGQSSVTVITQPGIMIAGQQFREHPVRTKCPACQAEVMTSTSFETGTFAWVIALVLCLFG